MAWEYLAERGMSDGPTVILFWLNDITGGLFINGTLFALWIIILLSMYFSKKTLTGDGDFLMCLSSASFGTFVITVILSLITKMDTGVSLISGFTFAVVIIILCISALLLFFDKSRDM